MRDEISAVILAGGRASRMGGADKGLQILDGEALYRRVYARLQGQVGRVSVNANRNQAAYGAEGLPVFGDDLPDFQGPLSGILSGLRRATTDYVLFVPCDCPFLPLNLAEKLKSAVENEKVFLAYAHDGERPHPTCCLVAKQLAGALGDYLAGGGRRMLQFMQQQGAVAVDFAEQPRAFENINTLDELASRQHLRP